MTPWVPRRMKMTNVFDLAGNIVNQVTFTDLLMVNIEQDFHLGATDGCNNLKRFAASNQVLARMVNMFI